MNDGTYRIAHSSMHLIISFFACHGLLIIITFVCAVSLLDAMTRTFCSSFDKNGMHRINIHQIRLLGAHTYRIKRGGKRATMKYFKNSYYFLLLFCWLEILLFFFRRNILRAACLTTWKKICAKIPKNSSDNNNKMTQCSKCTLITFRFNVNVKRRRVRDWMRHWF